MTDVDKVFQLIERTRKNIKYNDVDVCTDDIKKYYEMVLDACTKDYFIADPPTLLICETYNKYSELLHVRINKENYKYYVLYDYHMERIINRFVTIALADEESGHDVWKLAYDLFTEEMILNEENLLYLYYKMNSVALGDYELKLEDSYETRLISETQVSYILAHEIGHWLYGVTMEGKEKQVLNLSDTVENIMDNCKAILMETYEDLNSRYKGKDYDPLINEQKKIVFEDNRIMMECFADAIAYSYIISYVNAEYGTAKARLTAAKALFVLMMGLQILSMSYMTFSDNSFENSVSIRIVFLKNFLSQYYEDLSEEFSNLLGDMMDRFEHRITNIILESFTELEERAMNLDEYFSSNEIDTNILR